MSRFEGGGMEAEPLGVRGEGWVWTLGYSKEHCQTRSTTTPQPDLGTLVPVASRDSSVT